MAIAARELYSSDRFQRARAVLEADGAPWFIVSARHGLLEPDDVVEPYDEDLSARSATARREWAEWVGDELIRRLGRQCHVVLLCDATYAEPLRSALSGRGLKVEVQIDDG